MNEIRPNRLEVHPFCELLIQRLRQHVALRGVRISEFFRDGDHLRSGKCNLSNFLCGMAQLGISLSTSEIAELKMGYTDSESGKMDYRKFVDDVENRGWTATSDAKPTLSLGVEAEILKPRKPLMESVPVLRTLQELIRGKRVGFGDFFQDFDKLKKGFCSISNLRFVLSLLKLEVSEDQFAEILNLYGVEGSLVNYLALCEAVEDGLVGKAFEKDPEACPPVVVPRVKNLSGLSPWELASLANLELAIQERIQKRSLLLGPQFRSFDRAGSLAVTNSQFVRVMTTLGFELNKTEAELLIKRYALGVDRFGYREFCISMG